MDNAKSVLITGASGGIGLAIAEAVAKEGYTVVAHYNRNSAPIDALAERVNANGGSIRKIQFDISNREQCREVLEKDIAENGVYYGVITNADRRILGQGLEYELERLLQCGSPVGDAHVP